MPRYAPANIHSVLSSGRCSVSVWGAISRDGIGPLVRIEGSFTAARYCEILLEHLIPYALDGPFQDGYYLFQHDRSPVHKARAVGALLERCAVRQLPWPPNGADLNPIENIWGIMKKKLSSRRMCGGTADQLWHAVKEEWEALRGSPEIVTALYDSMPRRVGQVIAVDGCFSSH